ncbi:histidine phosphatase family protein [Granulicella sp. dw_53]|uniref:histidine phosphatase family protein n=1 Tax=Granulicella sp. dw_53 TaxID=2719792 RepID=UPI001BD1D9BE|nr:histidine phosphatase family protein [Granulicella sp. dw_53]
MTSLHFIRHAETDMAGRFCGHSDPPINAIGVQQICRLAESIQPASIHAIYCSDLRRAVVTAEALAKTFAVPIIRRRNLREIDFGDWEGLSWNEIELRDPTYASNWIKDFPNLSAPGGEPFADFEMRVWDEIEELLSFARFGRIAVVTHAGVMRVALRRFFNCSEQEAWSRTEAYCSSFVFEDVATPQEVA